MALPFGLICCYPKNMDDAIPDNNKKSRGRPRVDSTFVGVRIPPDLLAALDRWIEEDGAMVGNPKMGRPEALRRLAVEALQKLGLYAPR